MDEVKKSSLVIRQRWLTRIVHLNPLSAVHLVLPLNGEACALWGISPRLATYSGFHPLPAAMGSSAHAQV